MNGERERWHEWARSADLVLVGPAPPLRGGISLHTHRIAESARAAGLGVATASWSRLYPAVLFPGRSQRDPLAVPDPRSREVLDAIGPRSWIELGRILADSRATVVLQWWHPVVAPALVASTFGVARDRLVAVCHNVFPHEPVPGSALAARLVLSRCGRIVCHAETEAARVREITAGGPQVVTVPLPCLLGEAALGARSSVPPAELRAVPPGSRLFVAAGHVRPYKGIDVLLSAWTRAKRPAEARLVVAGESYLGASGRRSMREAAARDPSIILIDRYLAEEELVQILASSETLVVAHVGASQSGTIPIARALGVPVIASDAGGLASQAGPGTAVVRSGSEADLAAAIERQLAARCGGSPHGSSSSRAEEWHRVVEAIGFAARP